MITGIFSFSVQVSFFKLICFTIKFKGVFTTFWVCQDSQQWPLTLYLSKVDEEIKLILTRTSNCNCLCELKSKRFRVVNLRIKQQAHAGIRIKLIPVRYSPCAGVIPCKSILEGLGIYPQILKCARWVFTGN